MKKEMKVLISADVMFMLAGGLFGPIYALFVEDIGGGLAVAGMAYSVYCIVAGILIYFIGKFEDKFDNQEMLVVVGYFILSIGYLGYLFVSSPLHLYLLQALFGVGAAIKLPVYRGIYSMNLDKGKFASEWGIWDSFTYIFWGISSFLGGHIAKAYGFRFLFLIMFALTFIGFLISLALLLEKKK